MISVVLATYNEAHNLARCLEAVEGWADEIIVVDGSSTDATREIARSFGAEVIKTTNKPNFHINKQMAMDAAKGELILQLDADEVVDDELVQFIRQTHDDLLAAKETGPLEAFSPKAWWLKRKNFFLGTFLKKGGQYPDPVIRLYVSGFAALPQKDVHEQMSVDGEVGWADGHLLHYSNPSFADYLRKYNTYTSFSAQQLYDEASQLTFKNGVQHFIVKPIDTFFQRFFRHKGFMDGFPGFVFALMSALHYPTTYLKLWELYERE